MSKSLPPGSQKAQVAEQQQRFGQILRDTRKSKGYTGERLAKVIGTSQATVSKIETGVQQASLDYLARFTTVLGLSAAESERLLAEFNALPRTRPSEVLVPFSTFDFFRADDTERRQSEAESDENAADVIRVYQPHLVPGILQTDEYARCVFRLAGEVTEEGVRRGLAARKRRRKALYAKRLFAFLVTEGALRSRICSNDSMIAQLEHLSLLSQRPNVTIGVVPWTAPLPSLVLSSFYIFDDSTLSIELTHGQLRITSEHTIRLYLQTFRLVERSALVGADALQALERIIKDYRRLQRVEAESGPTL